MPLTPGTSNSVVSGNIRDMRAAGHPQRVAVAAAMRMKDQSPKGFAMGGAPMMGGLGSLQGLSGDIMNGFDSSKFGKALMGSPMGGSIGDMFGGGGGGANGGFASRIPQAPTGGAATNPMAPLMSHYAPSPAAGGGSSPAPAQPSSAMYGTTMVGPTAPAMPGRAAGGPAGPAWFAKNEARSMLHTGPIHSAVPGRTDRINMRVPNGSYIVPADGISHLGQNNSAAGLAKASRMFSSSGPFGTSLPKAVHGRGAPSAPAAPRPPAINVAKSPFASGGHTHEGAANGDDEGVEIVAAGGEFCIPPDVVRGIGEGNLQHGHAILDAWIKKLRKDHIATLKKLPGPAK